MKKEIEYRMTDILVVDDDSKDLETIREGLRLYPKRFNLITANNGKKVKEIIRTVMVDVVILDACMLGKDDPDLMRSLQKLQNSFPTTHVIIQSACDWPCTNERLSGLRFTSFRKKDIGVNNAAEGFAHIHGNLQMRSIPL